MTLPPLLLRTALSENDVKALSDWAAEAADAITKLRAERDDAIRHLADWSSRCGRTETDLAAVRELLRNIINLYNAYRRRGVAPAPIEYADVVRAIVRADAALAGKDAL